MSISMKPSHLAGNVTRVHPYSFAFNFEKNYDVIMGHQFVVNNWKVGFPLCVLYVAVIFLGRKFMENRKPFSLRGPLILWNLALSIFSFTCWIRLAPSFFHIWNNYGLYGTICDNRSLLEDKVSTFWINMFVYSKGPELIDTLFIVLRKSPLIFLHWYHHITVLLYTWYSCYQFTSSSRWFVLMNAFIHSIMYGYYALRAMRYSIPKEFAITLTTLQILQMVGGIFVNYMSYYYLSSGTPCGVTKMNLFWSILMYFSYFCLFCNFFYKAYLAPKPKKA